MYSKAERLSRDHYIETIQMNYYVSIHVMSLRYLLKDSKRFREMEELCRRRRSGAHDPILFRVPPDTRVYDFLFTSLVLRV